MFQPGRGVLVYAVKIVAASSGLGLMTAILLTQQSTTNATSKVQTQVQPQLLVLFQEPLDVPLVRYQIIFALRKVLNPTKCLIYSFKIHVNQRTLIFLDMILILCWMFPAGRNVLVFAAKIRAASSGLGLMTAIL